MFKSPCRGIVREAGTFEHDIRKGLDMIQEVREELRASVDLKYKNFHESLVPGLDSMMGVRVPRLREIARKIAKEDYKAFLEEADDRCYEELMLQGMVIGYAKMGREEREKALEIFVPKINNWAVCDCCCSTYKFMKTERDYWFGFLEGYLESEREYELRFAVVAMLDFFVTEEYIGRLLVIFNQVKSDAYYVKMAVSWAVSVCYVHFPKETSEFLKMDTMDTFTHNKSIQKIRESYRVSKEEKDMLLKWKREEKVL